MIRLSIPHGGQLIDRNIPNEAKQDLEARASECLSIIPDPVARSDIALIGNGALSPLTGFMKHDDFQSVLKDMRLANGVPWTIPIVLGVDEATAKGLSENQTVALREQDGRLLAVMKVSDVFVHEAQNPALGDIRHR